MTTKSAPRLHGSAEKLEKSELVGLIAVCKLRTSVGNNDWRWWHWLLHLIDIFSW